MKKERILSLLLGFTVCVTLGLTFDQIIQNVYDSSNTALRVNLVAGGSGSGATGATGPLGPTGDTGPSGPTGVSAGSSGTSNELQCTDNSGGFAAFPGDNCGGTATNVTAIGIDGALTCNTPELTVGTTPLNGGSGSGGMLYDAGGATLGLYSFPLDSNAGGTGFTGYNEGELLVGNAASALSKIAAPTATNQLPYADLTVDNLIFWKTPPPSIFQIEGAQCNNATAKSGWDIGSTNPPTPTCVEGTNTRKAYLTFPDAGEADAYYHLLLPSDWTGDIDIKGTWRTTATTGDVEWLLATACVADGETADPSWNTADSIVDTAKGGASQMNNFSKTAITVTGCAAGETIFVKFYRVPGGTNDTLGADANLDIVTFIVRRAPS